MYDVYVAVTLSRYFLSQNAENYQHVSNLIVPALAASVC